MDISIKNLSFTYEKSKLKVFNNINVNFNDFKSIAIIGSSGIGKSTLLKLISGLGNNYQGEITINKLTPKEFLKTGKTGFMFQDSSLLPYLNVRENIEIPNVFLNKNNSSIINENIKIVGLDNYQNLYPNSLSGGMKTRVALARTFSSSPKLLLLDEPFSSLDLKWKYQLYKELKLMQKANNSYLIIVTHNIEEAILLADNIFLINKNGIIENVCNIDKTGDEEITTNLITKYFKEYQEILKLILDNEK